MGWKQWVADATLRRSIGTFAMALAVAVVGMTTSVPAQAQITGTKHNLGSTGTGNNKFTGTAEICVFCHTPHGADNSASVPLWNRTLAAPASYTTYDSLGTSTLDGKTAPVGSVSIACLSCHDGTQSMSAVINAPGSGKAGDAAWLAGGWNVGGTATQTGGKLNTTAITNLGTDLSNDHPIGIQYGGGGISTAAKTGPTKDIDFKSTSNKDINGTTVWWVDTETVPNGTREKTDMMLYTRGTSATNPGYTGQANPEPFVECASCHDPHTSNATFLRIANTGSQVCLSCHIK